MTAATHLVFATAPAGRGAAGWDEIVSTTVDWYRTSTQSNGLAEATTNEVTS